MQIKPLTQVNAEAIVDWRYPAPYDFYDTAADPEDCAELLSAEKRGDRFYQVTDDQQRLIGYFAIETTDRIGVYEIGLGMAPNQAGQGLGTSFVRTLTDFVIQQYHPQKLLLNVAQFNQRAQKVYQRVGFQPVKWYTQFDDAGTAYPFVWLARDGQQ